MMMDDWERGRAHCLSLYLSYLVPLPFFFPLGIDTEHPTTVPLIERGRGADQTSLSHYHILTSFESNRIESNICH